MQPIKARYFVELLLHGLFWLVVYFALKGLTGPSFQFAVKTNNGLTQSMDGHAEFRYAWLLLGFLMLLFYSSIFLLFPNLQRFRNRFALVAVAAGWLLLWYAINDLVIGKLTHLPGLGHAHSPMPPSPGLVTGASAVFTPGEWTNFRWLMLLIFMAILGIAAAYFFIKVSIRQQRLRSQAEALQLSTELRFLRSQVNPHFLFNTLNNLFSMAQKKGNDELADGISKLSGMMRYMMDESNTEQVPLSKEIEYLDDCIALSQLRYAAGEVTVHFTHPDAAAATAHVAPMLLLPFVENAFKHGVAIGNRSTIDIALIVNEKKLIFRCENNLPAGNPKNDIEKTGIGLDNVKRRLQLLYPGQYRLVTQSAHGKYLVDLQIDLA